MSAFNTLAAEAQCPYCHKKVLQYIQFKFGDCWDHKYALGDSLKWGGNDRGERDAGEVKVRGISAQCTNCGRSGAEFAILISDNVLTTTTSDLTGAIDL